jgi:phosphatidylglycerophosphate synthase
VDSATKKEAYHSFFRYVAGFLGGGWLGRRGVSPNKVTLASVGLCATACVIWACQVYWPPAFWIGLPVAFVGAWCDLVDGSVARIGNRVTVFGSQLDSIMDRAVEGFMFAALAFVVAHQNDGRVAVVGCMLAMSGSFTVTYASSKAENLGLDERAGWGGRAERLVLLGIVVLLSKVSQMIGDHWWMPLHFRFEYAAYAVAILAWVTVVQRLRSLRRYLIERGTP